MIEKYKKEIEDLMIKMRDAEDFSKKIPVFAENIIDNKLTGKEEWVKYGERYKQIPLGWGINRGLYDPMLRRTVSNYKDSEYVGYLWNIYVNTVSIFDDHYHVGLAEIAQKIPLFFFDSLNSNFYATDYQIEALLEELNNWYETAKVEVQKKKNQEKIDKANKDIENAQRQLNELNG